MNKKVFVRGAAILLLLVLLAIGAFIANGAIASAHRAEHDKQCAEARKVVTQKISKDQQVFQQKLRELQVLLKQAGDKNHSDAQVKLEKLYQEFAQLLKKDLKPLDDCKGSVPPVTTPVVPTSTPTNIPPIPTQPSVTPPPPTPTQTPTSVPTPTDTPTSTPTQVPPTQTPPPPPPTPTQIPTPAPTTTPPTNPGMTAQEQQLAQQLFNQINQDRAAQGLPAYTLNAALIRSAYKHNVLMAGPSCGNNGNTLNLSHQCPGEEPIGNRVSNEGLYWSTVGENCGAGKPGSWSMVLQVHKDMLAEQPPNDGHRKNLLSSSFHQIGIGIYLDSHGSVWFTEDFAN